MRISGEWFECDDGFRRPIVRGEIENAEGDWEPALFLVDTGADCTVFSAALLGVLGFETTGTDQRLGGIGGTANSVQVPTQIRVPRDEGGAATFRGNYAAFTDLEALDMSILGRDILDMFAVIVDRPGDIVALIRPAHRYRIETV